MSRSILGWGLLGLVLYLFFLIIALPAQRAAAWTGLPLSEVRGSLWQGTATLHAGSEVIRDVRWSVHPVWPWQGVLGAGIEAGHQGWQAAGDLRLGWSGTLRLNAATLSGSLDSPLLARHIPLPITGQARLYIPGADWRGGLAKAEGVVLEVFRPRVMLGEPLALGDLAAEIEVKDGRVDGRLHDKGGPLELAGRLQGDGRAGLAFEATLKARPDAPPALAQNLGLLPPAPGGGARLQTRLPAPWLAPAQP